MMRNAFCVAENSADAVTAKHPTVPQVYINCGAGGSVLENQKSHNSCVYRPIVVNRVEKHFSKGLKVCAQNPPHFTHAEGVECLRIRFVQTFCLRLSSINGD